MPGATPCDRKAVPRRPGAAVVAGAPCGRPSYGCASGAGVTGHGCRGPHPPPTLDAVGIRRLLAAAVLLFLLVAAFAAGEFVGLGKAVRQSPATTWSYRCPLGGTVAIVRDAAECAALRRFPGVYQPGGAFWYGVAVGAGATLAVLLECRRRRRT